MKPLSPLGMASASALLAVSLCSTNCATNTTARRDDSSVMEISVPEQKMALFRDGELVKTYPISTSKFGLGDERGSYKTPVGKFEVAKKIGDGKPAGAVFKSRKWTGEVIEPDSPGRDPIVSRILWLEGLERRNRNAYSRYIYIHGTAAEKDVGTPASYGCIRMKSEDVIDLHDRIGEGAKVYVLKRKLDLEPAEPAPSPADRNHPALPSEIVPPAETIPEPAPLEPAVRLADSEKETASPPRTEPGALRAIRPISSTPIRKEIRKQDVVRKSLVIDLPARHRPVPGEASERGPE